VKHFPGWILPGGDWENCCRRVLAEGERKSRTMREFLPKKAALDAMEFKLWAERRPGELLAKTVRHRGGRPQKKRCHDGTVSPEWRYQTAADAPSLEKAS
jgi:hypothetical protein